MDEIKLNWTDSNRLMEIWFLNKTELADLVERRKIPAYFAQGVYEDLLSLDEFHKKHQKCIHDLGPYVDSMRFRVEDVNEFEMKNADFLSARQDIGPKERRELGRLQQEKEGWPMSIEAAVWAGILCEKSENEIIYADFDDYLFEKGFKELPNTTIREIWNALPRECRKKGGRPPKKGTTSE